MQRTPRVLYHYCSLSTFKSIFDNRSIWLSDIRKSNDSLELKWIMGQCQYYLINAWTNYVKKVQQEHGMEFVSLEHFKQFDKIYNLAKDYDVEFDTKNWVFCLSEKPDDLGQWRGYADDGQGMAIGFNSAFLKKINYIGDDIRSLSMDFQFDKVHYSKKDIKKFFDERAGLAKIATNTSPEEALQYMKRAVGFSFVFAPLYKNENFKDEKEWRIFYSLSLDAMIGGEIPGISPERNRFNDILTLEKYGFIQKNQTLVSHMELGLPKIKRAIHSITIGPKAKVTPFDVQLYLMSIGLLESIDDKSIEIQRSKISYR